MPSTFIDDPLIAAIREAFEAIGGAAKNVYVAKWMNRRYATKDEPFRNTWNPEYVSSYIRRCSVNMPGAIGRHPGFPRFLFCRGRGEFELYNPERHGSYDNRGYLVGEDPDALQSEIAEDIQEIADQFDGKREFAYEAHLRDYLARNLGLLEPGLSLWNESEIEAVEYALEGRRIDILAKDRSGVPVVVELKLSKGHERTLGQALYYRGKLKQLLSLSRVRIIMVASEISDELRIASMEVADVDLFSYALTMQVQKLDLKFPVS